MTDASSPTASNARRAQFVLYLRTGRWFALDENESSVETKFNPWHDPQDGRFTFSGQGNYSPGGFGGGGATGTWKNAPPSQPRKPDSQRPPAKRDPAKRIVFSALSSTVEKPYKRVTRNGYGYDLDTQSRTRRVQGEIHAANPERRSKRLQASAGKPDRRATDDGGHYIASRFGGPGEAFNHFAQDARFNRGKYRAIEDSWAKEVRAGHKVFVDITPTYQGDSKRPYTLTVRWSVDGEFHTRNLPNEPKGR